MLVVGPVALLLLVVVVAASMRALLAVVAALWRRIRNQFLYFDEILSERNVHGGFVLLCEGLVEVKRVRLWFA